MKKTIALIITLGIICVLSGTASGSGYQVTNELWIKAVINTVEKGPVEAVWQKGGEDTTSRGDTVIWGHFYANPSDVTWGSANNPDLFVKIWFDVSGRIDVNYFHVSVPDIEVYTDYFDNGAVDEQGTTTMCERYIRHYFEGGQSYSEESSGSNCGVTGTGDGIIIQSVSIAGIPTATDATPDIDVALHFCDVEQTTLENGLFNVYANITTTATNLNPSNNAFPGTIEECTITYLKVNEDPASPILGQQTIYPNCPLIEGVNSCTVLLIDIARKIDYWNGMANGLNLPAEYPTKYIASYNCKYYNQFRESGTFNVEYMIFLADFDTC